MDDSPVSAPADPWRAAVESFLPEDDVLVAARAAADRFGYGPIGAGAGAGLQFLAATVRARTVVEIGTGTGVSGLWLLRGMVQGGTLTSIDVDPEALRLAKATFTDAGYGPSRLRLINGMGLEVLPRLTDGGYDLVFVDAEPAGYPRYVSEAVRLLREGGVLVLDDVLSPSATDPTETPGGDGVREAIRMVREDDRLVPILLPLGEGLLAAVRTAAPA